jgi:biopolymer transport protein ExbB
MFGLRCDLLLLIGGFEWFTGGGWAMWPLLALSIISWYIIIERAVFFATQVNRVDRDLDDVLRGGARLPERLEGELPPYLARALKDGRLVLERAELAIQHEMLRAARSINTLDTISQVAPMLGLLGTVTGMVSVFHTVAAMQGSASPSNLAGGIGQALIATVGGLLVAIPAYMSYRIFRSRLLHWENRLQTVVGDAQQIIAEGAVQVEGRSPAVAKER